MKKQQLEPRTCPFCGKPAEALQIPENDEKEMLEHPQWKWNNPGKWIVGCWTEMCMGNINHMTMVFVTEENAIEAWNRRSTDGHGNGSKT